MAAAAAAGAMAAAAAAVLAPAYRRMQPEYMLQYHLLSRKGGMAGHLANASNTPHDMAE